jgi:hypothetical protein
MQPLGYECYACQLSSHFDTAQQGSHTEMVRGQTKDSELEGAFIKIKHIIKNASYCYQ